MSIFYLLIWSLNSLFYDELFLGKKIVSEWKSHWKKTQILNQKRSFKLKTLENMNFNWVL